MPDPSLVFLCWAGGMILTVVLVGRWFLRKLAD